MFLVTLLQIYTIFNAHLYNCFKLQTIGPCVTKLNQVLQGLIKMSPRLVQTFTTLKGTGTRDLILAKSSIIG